MFPMDLWALSLNNQSFSHLKVYIVVLFLFVMEIVNFDPNMNQTVLAHTYYY